MIEISLLKFKNPKILTSALSFLPVKGQSSHVFNLFQVSPLTLKKLDAVQTWVMKFWSRKTTKLQINFGRPHSCIFAFFGDFERAINFPRSYIHTEKSWKTSKNKIKYLKSHWLAPCTPLGVEETPVTWGLCISFQSDFWHMLQEENVHRKSKYTGIINKNNAKNVTSVLL